MTIETYPEMNAKIVELLRWDADDPMSLYAAQRIEELEAEIKRLQVRLKIFGANVLPGNDAGTGANDEQDE